MKNLTLIIRPAAVTDASQIATLHALSFGGADAYVDPWKEEDFQEMIRFGNLSWL